MAQSETNAAMGVFSLVNMDCSGCDLVIAKSLKKIDGIRDVGINYVTDKVYVKYDPAMVASGNIREAIEKAGYKAFDVTHRGMIQG